MIEVSSPSSEFCEKYFLLPYSISLADQYRLALEDYVADMKSLSNTCYIQGMSSAVLEATAEAFSTHHYYLDGI